MMLLLLILSSPLLAGKFTERSKNINKNYTVSAATMVEVDNAFGTVNVTGWDQNKVELAVEIKVEAKNEQAAQELLDRISVEIDDKRPESLLSFRTDMEEKNNYWNKNGERFEINFTIKMPRGNALRVDNRHGETVLGDLSGEMDIETRHGDLRAGKLSGDVDIEVSFGSLYATQLGEGKLKLRHSSDSEVRMAGALRLDMEHSELEIDESDAINLSLRHGELELEKGTVVDGTIQHSNLEVGQLTQGITASMQHSSLEIDQLAKDFAEVNLDVQFTGVEIGIAQGASFSFEADFSFGDVDYPSGDFEITHREKEMHTVKYKGKAGSGGDARIRIDGSHGNARLRWK